MRRQASPQAARQRGIAALTVVMILFFVMALVAAYTNRNLVFEQRISANSYRSNRALEAADAGVEWTVAMLNAGRVDDRCQPTNNVAFSDFRSRYLVDSDAAVNVASGEGGYDVQWGANLANRIYPACIIRDGALSCICPVPAAALPDIGAPADGIGSAYRITFIRPGNAIRAGVMQFTSRGCANPGTGATSCFAQTNAAPAVDGVSAALTTVGLLRALPIVPIAPVTAGTTVTTSGAVLRVINGSQNQTDGLTVRAGGAIDSTALAAVSQAGGVGELAAAAVAPNEGWFRSLFGMDSATYRQQPAVVRVDCAAGCTLANLNAALTGFPRNPIWVDGDLNIDTAANLGAVDPLMLLVTGNLTVSANAALRGFIHANQVNWSAAATLTGAVVSATSFTATAGGTITYDLPTLNIIRLRYGSFVRAPGSWNLF